MMKNFKKHVLAVLMVMIFAVSMFAATAVIASAAEEVDPAELGAEVTEVVEIAVNEPETEAGTEEMTEPETEAETEAATEAETVAETTDPTASTEAATVATEAPTIAPKNANTPKTGDDKWLYIGLGVIGAALVIIIITVVVKKKSAK